MGAHPIIREDFMYSRRLQGVHKTAWRVQTRAYEKQEMDMKWKLEMEMKTKNAPITGAVAIYD